MGDLVHVMKAQVNWTGRTSMEVGVRVPAERWNESTPSTQVGWAYLVFAVAADNKRRYQEARIRRTHRLARRAAEGIED